MKQTSQYLSIYMSKTTFKDFAVFDTMQRHKRWRYPFGAAGIFLACAIFLFGIQEQIPNAFLVGTIFCIVAVGLSAGYLRNFYRSIPKEAEKMKLDPPRLVYSLSVTRDNDAVLYYLPGDKKPSERFTWKSIDSVWITPKAIYIYVTPERTLTIPSFTKNVNLEELWTFIANKVDDEKMHDVRKFNLKKFLTK